MDRFDIARDAGLRPAELARLLKVSRVTASLWLNGHRQPHALIVKRVDKLLDAVGRALEAGDLPAPVNLSQADRKRYINDCIVKQLSAQA